MRKTIRSWSLDRMGINGNVESLLSQIIEEYEKYGQLMVSDNVLNKILDKMKEIIGITNFCDTKSLTDTDGKLPDDNTF